QDEDGVFLMSEAGQSLRMRMKDLRVMGRSTQGVKLVALKADDNLIDMQKIETVEPTKEE
ncbi:MAG: hypothetical protein K1060chlam4_01428, partial [Candidatus Anoxychlamydiales bacterium]|nr:hypothetical protein [Candidatus Anoxychlamydiales bacterium]